MPELVEVERYRRVAAAVVGWRVAGVDAPDALVAPDGARLSAALAGRTLQAARRRGKLLILDTTGPALGIRFGMTGMLLLDGNPAVDGLLYAPAPRHDRWVRFRLHVVRGRRARALTLCDPRRLGRVLLDPDEEALGPDAASVTLAALAAALGTGTGAGPPATSGPGAGSAACPPATSGPGAGPSLKARLLDQRRLAGVGNLIADEVLWRAGLDPRRPARGLSGPDVRRLHRHLRATIDALGRQGGSHTGTLMPERRMGGRCPKDGAELLRATVGGRTTWWCPAHQG